MSATKRKPDQQLPSVLLDTVTELRSRVTAWGDAGATGELRVADLADRIAQFGTPSAKAAATALTTVTEQILTQVQNSDVTSRATVGAALVNVDTILVVASTNGADAVSLRRVHEAEKAVAGLETEQAATLDALRGAINSGDVTEVMRLRPEVEVTYPQNINTARLELLNAQTILHSQAVDTAVELDAVAAERLDNATETVTEAQAVLDRATAHAAVIRSAKLSTGQTLNQLAAAHDIAVHAQARMTATIEHERTALFRRLAGLPDNDEATPAVTERLPEAVSSLGARRDQPTRPPSGEIAIDFIDRTPITPTTKIESVADYFGAA